MEATIFLLVPLTVLFLAPAIFIASIGVGLKIAQLLGLRL